MHVIILPSESFLTSWAPLGGIFQMDLSRALVAQGVSVGVIAVGKVPAASVLRRVQYPAQERNEGVSIFRRYLRLPIPQRLDWGAWLGSLYARLAADALEQYIRAEGRPSLLHAHNIRYGGVVARRLSQQFGIPFAVTEHSSEYATGQVKASRIAAFRDVWTCAAARSVVSESLAAHVVRTLDVDRGAITVIPNMLPAGFGDEPRFGLARPAVAAFTFLNVAEFVPIKGHRLLLQAFARVFAGGKERLRLVGGGALEPEFRSLAERLGIAEQVTFCGRLSRDAIRSELRAAQAFVLASVEETFGVVVIEALSQGVPVVTTACGGPEDLIGPADGFIVPNHDVGALADGLRRMRDQASRFSPTNSAQRCRERFAPDVVARGYLAWYAAAVDGAA